MSIYNSLLGKLFFFLFLIAGSIAFLLVYYTYIINTAIGIVLTIAPLIHVQYKLMESDKSCLKSKGKKTKICGTSNMGTRKEIKLLLRKTISSRGHTSISRLIGKKTRFSEVFNGPRSLVFNEIEKNNKFF